MEAMKAKRKMQVCGKCEQIEKLLRDNDIFADCTQYSDLPVLIVSIRWGDWKHEHARARWLIEQNVEGVTYLNTRVTEDNGSDCYSAEHRYFLN